MTKKVFLMGHPRPLFNLFLSSNKHYNFTTNKCEKCPSSLRCWDSSPRPLEYESPPITTGPRLPKTTKKLFQVFRNNINYFKGYSTAST